MKLTFYLFIVFFFVGFTFTFAQNKNDTVIVLPMKIAAPANAKKIGTIKVGNNSTEAHCDYEAVVAEAKEQARAMGGNIAKITELIAPAFVSKCYKIKADVYYASKLPDYHLNSNNTSSDKAGYVTLCIYRLVDTTLLATSYHVHLMDNDSVICTVKSKSHDAVNIYKEGAITLWAETEQRTELTLDAKYGKTYYIRCGLMKGEMRMVPVMKVVDNSTGEDEFKKISKRKRDTGLEYLQQIH